MAAANSQSFHVVGTNVRDVIDKHWMVLSKIKIEDIIDSLIQNKVLSAEQYGDIKKQCTENDVMRGLLKYLQSRGPSLFSKFCKVLRECGMEDKAAMLEGDKGVSHQELQTFREEIDGKVEKLQKTNEGMQVKLDEHLAKIADLERTIKEMQSEKQALSKKVAELTRQYDTLKGSIADKDKNMDQLEEQNKELLKKVSELENKIQDLHKDIAEKDMEIATLQSNRNSLISEPVNTKFKIRSASTRTKAPDDEEKTNQSNRNDDAIVSKICILS